MTTRDAHPGYWLLKSEPSTFSIDDLAARAGRRDSWTGVRNYQARNYLRSMQRGDRAFFYHSSARQTGVAGIVQIASVAYPDPTAFDRNDDHYDPKSHPERPIWYTLDVRLERKLRRIVPLAELRAQRELSDLMLLRPGNRLSVMPVSAGDWNTILRLE
ncbi:MAG TPA: EVE domain-containing protein [Steroidobacteraceae bacterium]|jgi:predicted RNA-binding protein with PUA-like domain|nr:EVE domain-containing protein [Steroidobacteraceae bacterium]